MPEYNLFQNCFPAERSISLSRLWNWLRGRHIAASTTVRFESCLELKKMDRETLKTLQGPLKLQYQSSPETARVCLTAEGSVEFDTPGCRAVLPPNDGKFIKAGLHPNAGGDGTQACSGEILLQSLVTCAGTTLAAVSISMGLQLSEAQVHARGWLDFRGTLGVDRSAPVGFLNIDLMFRVSTNADDAIVDKLIELTERYCVIYQTLINGTQVTTARIR